MSRDYPALGVTWHTQLTQMQQDMDWLKTQINRGYLSSPVGRQSMKQDVNELITLLQQMEEALSE